MPPSEPRHRAVVEWLWTSTGYAGTLIVVALLYLLSFGPVDLCCNKVVTTVTTPNAYSVTVRYPAWVSVLYRPAFYLRFRSDLYRRYLELWSRGDELNR